MHIRTSLFCLRYHAATRCVVDAASIAKGTEADKIGLKPTILRFILVAWNAGIVQGILRLGTIGEISAQLAYSI